MGWWAWVGAVVVAALVLGFCVYELGWKSRRLLTEVHRLAGLSATLTAIQTDVRTAQARLADAASLTER